MNKTIESTKLKSDHSSDKKSQEVSIGRSVLQAAADGILLLKQELNGNFVEALDLLSQTKGRVIVCGMGKSGHIANKIAATLASTGTPAFFVHPGEASHGDLGMILENDLILALSNSGETIELEDIIAHAKRFKIPLITITSQKNSTLDKASDVSLIIPQSKEANPLGLAPTTTTTAMLVLGDAIALSLLERQKFSSEDFHLLHPGGKLGKQFLKVSDLMHKGDEVPLVPVKMKMSEVIIIMTTKHFGCAGVVNDNGILEGVITDGDLRRHMTDDLLAYKAEEIMTVSSISIEPSTLASAALAIMNFNSITNLFITKEKKPIGIIHVHDCLRAGII